MSDATELPISTGDAKEDSNVFGELNVRVELRWRPFRVELLPD